MNTDQVERGTPPWKVAPLPTYWSATSASDFESENAVFGAAEGVHASYPDWSGVHFGSGSTIQSSEIDEVETTGGRRCYVVVGISRARDVESDAIIEPRDRYTKSAGELLATIKHALHLNVSQLAQVCLVQRPTIYEWLRGVTPRRSNVERLWNLARIAEKYDLPNSKAYKSAIEVKDNGTSTSVVDLLSEQKLNDEEIERQLSLLQSELQTRKKASISDKLRAAGYSERTDEEARRILDSAADTDFGPDYD